MRIGSTPITDIKIGSTQITKVIRNGITYWQVTTTTIAPTTTNSSTTTISPTTTVAPTTTTAGQTYYVKNGGDDSKSGLDDANAWATIATVNNRTFNPGDQVLFKCNSVWRETLVVPSAGSSANYITFSSYSTGSKPKILASNTTTWINTSGNIWESEVALNDPYNIGATDMSIWFEETNGSITWGNVKKTYVNLSELATEYDWTWNGNKIYIYSATDPDTRYTSVEIAQRTYPIELNGKEYLEVNGIDMFYGLGGIHETYPTAGLTGMVVRNCEIAYHGVKGDGGYGINFVYNNSLIEFNTIHDCGRRSISLYNYGASDISGIIVQNNMMYNGFHTTGVDIAPGSVSGSDSDISNITIRNNLIYDDENKVGPYSELIYVSEDKVGAGRLIGTKIYNNIFKYPSMAAIHFYNVDTAEVYNNTFYETANITNAVHINVGVAAVNIKIKNNIFYSTLNNDTNARGHAISLYSTITPDKVDADYNVYYRINNTLRVISVNSTNYYMNNIGIIRSVLGWEAHGQMIDPLFTSSSVYTLQASSPAVGTGVFMSGYVTDYAGVTVSNPPNIGAYQTITPDIPVYISSAIANATPTLLEMTYSFSLANIIPATSAFTVLVNSVARTVNTVSISTTKVTLTLASAIVFGDVITVAYTKPVTNPIQTASGGQAVSITAQSVTNNVEIPTGSELVTNGTFDSAITPWSGTNWAWSATAGGVALHTIGSSTSLLVNILTIGKTYRIVITVVMVSAGTMTVRAGTESGLYISASGTYTTNRVCSGSTNLMITPNNFDGYVDNISCKEVL